MKTINKLCFLLWVTSALLILSPLTGCNSTPQRIAYDTVQGGQVTVEAAMTAWGDYVAQYHPPASQEAKVAAAYKKYQAAASLVIDAEQTVEMLTASTNTPPAQVSAAQASKVSASQNAANALADLVSLLRSFKVKI